MRRYAGIATWVGWRVMTYCFAKRCIDLAGAAVGLAITAVLYIPIGIAIRRDSPGPILFAQDRLGLGMRIFRIYKFRTMHAAAPPNGAKPAPADERVTRVGRFLRRSSLDELPQFYNVLRGDMSLVGPRPEQVALAACYDAYERRRFEVKPGLTGWWQVSGRPQPMYAHVDYDVYYVEHQSLWLDLRIIWRTLSAVVSGEGAL